MSGLSYLNEDYKEVLKEQIEQNQNIQGYRTRLASAAGCQKSFLSQVVNSHVHLTLDHAANLCRFWDFDDNDTEYFLTLVLYARASAAELRNLLKNRIEEFQRNLAPMDNRVKNAFQMDGRAQAYFYSRWYISAIFMMVEMKEFRTAAAIAKKLSLEERTVQETLDNLNDMGLIQKSKQGGYQKVHSDVFLKKSMYRNFFLGEWRRMAMVKKDSEDCGSIYFTNLFAVSEEDYQKIHETILQSLQRAREIAIPSSKEERLLCLNLDFFEV